MGLWCRSYACVLANNISTSWIFTELDMTLKTRLLISFQVYPSV